MGLLCCSPSVWRQHCTQSFLGDGHPGPGTYGTPAVLWDLAERRRELTLPSLATFGPNVLECFEEKAFASIWFQHWQVKSQNVS